MVSGETSVGAGYAGASLPNGIRLRFIEGVNGLRMHMLEAGYEECHLPRVER